MHMRMLTRAHLTLHAEDADIDVRDRAKTALEQFRSRSL